MDGLTLLAAARDAGLSVAAVGDRLVIRGPKTAEHIAKELIGRKADVLAALRTTPAAHAADYQSDRSRLFLADPEAFFARWRRVDGAWVAPWHRPEVQPGGAFR